MSGGIFVFCETKDGAFRRVSGELLTQFRSVADAWQQPLVAVIVGQPVADELPQLSEWAADKVFHVTSPQLTDAPEALAGVLTDFIKDAAPSLLVFGNTPLARTVAPRIAEGAGAAFVGDCVAMVRRDDGLQLVRPVYGSKLLCRSDDRRLTSGDHVPAQRPRVRRGPVDITDNGEHRDHPRRPAHVDGGRDGGQERAAV